MRAIVHERYGAPEAVLGLREIDRPEPGAGEVLVRVRAAGVHAGDCFTVRGAPFLVRIDTGLRRPRRGVPGYDLAGEVVETGEGVTRFAAGDLVFGVGRGTCAEYAVANEDALAAKPEGLSIVEAAAVPTSGLAALHGLRDAGRLEAGRRLLVNGASGGVGTFAVQIGKALGAEVTGVCGPDNVETVRGLGADRVIDYSREDFTRGGTRYDLVLDNVENRSLAECRRVLAPRGTLVLNSGTGARGLRFLVRLVRPLLLHPFVRHRLRRYLSTPNARDLAVLTEMIGAGKVRPVVGRTFPLRETPAALRHLETGHARGKVVVEV